MQWFENENFWLNYGPIMFEPQRWAEAPNVAEAICNIAGLSSGNSIMDAGCGPGRVSLELALKGLDVTGVDIIQPFLDAAKESAEDEEVNINLVNADLRYYNSEKKFDAVVKGVAAKRDKNKLTFKQLVVVCRALDMINEKYKDKMQKLF